LTDTFGSRDKNPIVRDLVFIRSLFEKIGKSQKRGANKYAYSA
jgi:hypothetical protein